MVGHGMTIAGLLVAQIALGISVLVTGSPEHKKFWVTNFHVLNGLAILAVSFGLAVRAWSAGRRESFAAEFLGSEPRRSGALPPGRG
jgi:heme A synthase